jgi:FlaG/FlaF family flagellin (archaellin)
LVALLVASAGCLGLGVVGDDANATTTTEEYDNATAVQQAAAEAMADVDTYTFTMEMSMESENLTMVSESEGAANVEQQRLRQNQTVEMSTPEGRNLTVNSSSYLIGETMYTSYEGQSWETMNISEMPTGMDADAVWNQSSQMRQQQQLLNASTVSFGDEKTTTIDGQEVYVIELDVDAEAFQNAMMEGMNDGQMQQQMNQSDLQFDEISATQYVATDSMRIVQSEMTIEMTVNGQTMRQEMVMTFDNFNEDLTIEPPVETNQTAA